MLLLSETKKQNVQLIYKYMKQTFPEDCRDDNKEQWTNSVRHNLSLHKDTFHRFQLEKILAPRFLRGSNLWLPFEAKNFFGAETFEIFSNLAKVTIAFLSRYPNGEWTLVDADGNPVGHHSTEFRIDSKKLWPTHIPTNRGTSLRARASSMYIEISLLQTNRYVKSLFCISSYWYGFPNGNKSGRKYH